jgi:hypothetical protein
MSERPGHGAPDGENTGEQESGTVSFGRMSGGTRNGLPFLSALSFDFDDRAPDARAGKHAFESAIFGLNTRAARLPAGAGDPRAGLPRRPWPGA